MSALTSYTLGSVVSLSVTVECHSGGERHSQWWQESQGSSPKQSGDKKFSSKTVYLILVRVCYPQPPPSSCPSLMRAGLS